MEFIPKLDATFKFESKADHHKATDNTIKLAAFTLAIKDGMHPSPKDLEIDSYTCRRCSNKVTVYSFSEIPGYVGMMGMEKCNVAFKEPKPASEEQPIRKTTNSSASSGEQNNSNPKGHPYNILKDGTMGLVNAVQGQMEDASIVRDRYKDGRTVSYNPQNFERFHKSPCFSQLGYNPQSDPESLEKNYCDCEKRYYWGLAGKTTLGLLILGAIGYMIYLSRKNQNNISP
jgi:hypothetical protein